MKLSKTSRLLLATGAFIIALAGLGFVRYQQIHERNQLIEAITLVQQQSEAIQLEQEKVQLQQEIAKLRQSMMEGMNPAASVNGNGGGFAGEIDPAKVRWLQ